jgi:hypothetical protein
MTMPNVDDVFGGDALKASDLKGRDISLVIAGVEVMRYADGSKLKVTFQRTQKYLPANKTNSNRLKMMFGPETDKWIGKRVTLYPDMVPFQGKDVAAVRVRLLQQEPAPGARKASAEIAPADAFDEDFSHEVPF